MSARYWAIGAVLASVLANTGCVTNCHQGYEMTLKHGPYYDTSTPCRNRVHVFTLHGLTPSTDSGLNTLRLKLGENGFAKVGMAELCSAHWVKNEIERIRLHDPDARFVLVGYDLGGAVAVSLTRDLTAKGVPVDALILLNPLCCSAEPCGVNTLLIKSAKATSCVPHSAKVVVPDASHFGLPAHPATVTAVTELLREIALQHSPPPAEEIPEWSYQYAPESRRVPAKQLRSDWDFLADKPGTTRAIASRVVTQPTPVAEPPSTYAGPVLLKR